jgi:hypothetical protein
MVKKRKLVLVFLIAISLSGCGSSSDSSIEVAIPTPSAKAITTLSDFPTLFEFSVCGVRDSVIAMESVIQKIEQGYLAKKDLDEHMGEISISLEMINNQLKDPDKTDPNKGESSFLNDYEKRESIEIQYAISNGWDKEFISFYDYYAKKRVILIESNKIDFSELRQNNNEIDELVTNYCEKIK